MKCVSADPTENALAKLDYWEEDISNIEEKTMDCTNTDIIVVVRYQYCSISIVPDSLHTRGWVSNGRGLLLP